MPFYQTRIISSFSTDTNDKKLAEFLKTEEKKNNSRLSLLAGEGVSCQFCLISRKTNISDSCLEGRKDVQLDCYFSQGVLLKKSDVSILASITKVMLNENCCF